ncbi:F0F1 ATP synthase subunit B [bacterium]|nr:F0F1 ATP synthase subunit B [bacterium]
MRTDRLRNAAIRPVSPRFALGIALALCVVGLGGSAFAHPLSEAHAHLSDYDVEAATTAGIAHAHELEEPHGHVGDAADLIVASTDAHAAEETHGSGDAGGHGAEYHFPIGEIVASVINFVIFVALLVWLAKSGVRSYYKRRAETLQAAVREAEAAMAEAKATQEELTARLSSMTDEAERILENARAAAEKHGREGVEAARKQAERILADAEATVQTELRETLDALSVELAERVVNVARDLLKERVDASAQRKLVDEYINRVDEA